jgi:KRAB domain-containing zinc finger protein
LFKCEICNKTFCGLQKLNQHLKAKHNKVYSQKQKLGKKALRVSNCVVEIPDGTILNCAECYFTTPLIKSMKDHIRIVYGWRGLQLYFQVFTIRSDRERHEQNEHLGGQRVYCDRCGENFDIPLQLERHDYYVHRGGREYVSMKQRQDRAISAPKICPYCTKEYSSKSKLNRHIRVVHEQSIVIKCKICSKTFCSQSSLKVHMDRHTGNRTCHCPYCPYTDFRGYMINQHVQIEHPGKEKPFKRNLVFSAVKQEQPVDLSQQPHQQIVLQKDMGDIVYEMTDSIGQNGEIVLQVPTQQIEVNQVDMEQCVEEAVAAGNVLLEYYVVQ